MAAFPILAETIIAARNLTAEAIAKAGLERADYAVIKPAVDGVRVRAASDDEQRAYEHSPASAT